MLRFTTVLRPSAQLTTCASPILRDFDVESFEMGKNSLLPAIWTEIGSMLGPADSSSNDGVVVRWKRG